LIFSICWNDPAGECANKRILDDPSLKLVNDLDLRIIDLETNETHFPFILDPSNPSEKATTGDNFRDNVEKIKVVKEDEQKTRKYKIQITIKNQLVNEEQSFSLIIGKVRAG
ncbi:MAG: peptidase S8, partial [Crocinitomicaceae bacterium]|nr:peptidase S8 [Crocinitomicaceae bacterium]